MTKAITLTAAGATHVGRKRENNEDAWLITDLLRERGEITQGAPVEFSIDEGGVLLAVSDGMGGAKAGEVASALVVESLRRGLNDDGKAGEKPVDVAIKAAVERANREVWQAGHESEKRGMGATLTAVYLEGAVAHIAEVGDSRAYILRGERIRQITRDQSFAQMLLDAGVLKPDEVANYPMKNVVLQAMGQKESVSVEIGRLQLRRGDRLLLCSDGLSNKVAADEMKDILASGASLVECCNKLIALANERGGEDNITVVVAMLEGDGLERFIPTESVTQTLEVVQGFDTQKAPSSTQKKEPEFGEPNTDLVRMPAAPVEKKPGSTVLIISLVLALALAAVVTWMIMHHQSPPPVT